MSMEQVKGREDGVTILLEKVAGVDTCRKDIQATSPEALINGLGILVITSARMMGVDEQTLMAVLAARLFGQGQTG